MPKKKVDSPPVDVPRAAVDGLLLYQAETSLAKLVERSLLKSQLTLPQMLLLGALYWDGRALVPRRVRNTLVVEAQTLTGLIDRLENQGWAKRLSHPKDRRKILVQLTPEGRKKYEEASPHSDRAAETYFKALTASERRQLSATLMKLRGAAYPLLDLRHDAAYPSAG
jgi:DNA-binding MarR family transcriptional regulator